jgi:hypothetical protein
MPSHDLQHMAIELLNGKQLPWGPIYNLSEKELNTLHSYLEVKLKWSWMRLLKSPAGAPIFFVPKKHGTLWLCVDFQGFNQIMKKSQYPLPLISEAIDQLSGAHYYTKLDICEAYHRLQIAPGDEWETAFHTRYGHYKYTLIRLA